MKFVGAKKVGCEKCLFCRSCLVDREILYSTDSVISQRQAKREGLRCSSCNCLLHLQKESEPLKQKKNEYSKVIS